MPQAAYHRIQNNDSDADDIFHMLQDPKASNSVIEQL